MCLGERRVWKGKGAKRKCVLTEDHFIYIPILETIQCLLRKDTVISEVSDTVTVHTIRMYVAMYVQNF